MRNSELSSGAAAACGRLDALVRTVGPELGRWMLELAERLAAEGRRCRSIDGEDQPSGGGGRT
mgnify:CR=1 FL=1|jgi:hypothetical protein